MFPVGHSQPTQGSPPVAAATDTPAASGADPGGRPPPSTSVGDERRTTAVGGRRRGCRLRRPLRRGEPGDDGGPDRAFHLPGPPPVEPAVGALLAVLAAGSAAHSVVSIGSGGGLVGLWLLRGMRPDGVLTALDGDPEQLRAAKAFADSGHRPEPGPADLRHPGRGAAQALPRRLRPGRVCRAAPVLDHLPELLGLVRVGGTLACHGVLEGGRVADRTARDPQTVAWREMARVIGDDETLLPAVLPVGAGLLLATKRA